MSELGAEAHNQNSSFTLKPKKFGLLEAALAAGLIFGRQAGEGISTGSKSALDHELRLYAEIFKNGY